MISDYLGKALFILGAVITFISVSMGNSLQADLFTTPVDIYLQQQGPTGLFKFMFFAFGFPLGIGISLLGSVLLSGVTLRQFIGFLIVVTLGLLAAGVVPAILGKHMSATFFGTGGYSIMILVLLVFWFWGKQRKVLTSSARRSVDFQGLGYLCFALVAWNICGVATMPSFALEPEKMITMGSNAFAIGQMKSIMVLFVTGWLFTFIGAYLAIKNKTE